MDRAMSSTKPDRRWSLRTRLLTLLLCLAAGLFGASAGLNWHAQHQTSERLFDESLRKSADLLLQLAEHELAEHGLILGIALLQAEARPAAADLRFQIWTLDMQNPSQSDSLPQAPLLPFGTEGFGWSEVNGARWRAYAKWNDAHTLQIQVAQEPSRKAELDRLTLWQIAGGAALLLALASALIWVIVDSTLAPLQRTAVSVSERSEQDLRDVDIANAPREVLPLVDALNRLLQRIRTALQAERRFTADAAHELRTPLAAIRANAQVLLAARDPAEREETARDLLASVDRGTHLIEQLLELARADRSLQQDRLREVELADVAREQLDAHRAEADRCGIDLRGELASGMVRGDPGLLSVMVRNLVDNALRYTPRGGHVTIAVRQGTGGPTLVVDDDGPGIPLQDRERVFERFSRLPGRRATGSGLGLSIVRRVADLHRASVLVSEGPGERGTSVTVRFGAGAEAPSA